MTRPEARQRKTSVAISSKNKVHKYTMKPRQCGYKGRPNKKGEVEIGYEITTG